MKLDYCPPFATELKLDSVCAICQSGLLSGTSEDFTGDSDYDIF